MGGRNWGSMRATALVITIARAWVIGLLGVNAVLTTSCSRWIEQSVSQLHEQAVHGVETQLAEEFRGRLRLQSKPNAWGEGIIVFASDEPFIWFFARGERAYQIYALGREETRVTPTVPLLETARADVRDSVGLAGVSRERIRIALGDR
jgi:hypothetical protein